MSGEFDQLLAASWRSLEFPTTGVEVSFEQDLVEHRYYGRDGAHIEATGRGPLNITAHVPLINGIVPGRNENWDLLYPDLFRALLLAATDRTVDVFVHPELGEITCYVKSVDFSHASHIRNGVKLTIKFTETVLDFDANNGFLEGNSPVDIVSDAIQTLDASSADITHLVPDAYVLPFTLNDFLDALSAIGDQFSIQTKLASGKLNQMLYHLGKLEDSLIRAKNALLWPAIDAVEKIKSGLHWVLEHPPGGKTVSVWTVGEDVSLGSLLIEIPGATFGDVVQLNPGIMSQVVVPKGTRVRYFAQSKLARSTA